MRRRDVDNFIGIGHQNFAYIIALGADLSPPQLYSGWNMLIRPRGGNKSAQIKPPTMGGHLGHMLTRTSAHCLALARLLECLLSTGSVWLCVGALFMFVDMEKPKSYGSTSTRPRPFGAATVAGT